MDEATLIRRYDFMVGRPLKEYLLLGLKYDDSRVVVKDLQDMIEMGVGGGYTARLNNQTTAVFDEFVASQRRGLLQLARRLPGDFDGELSKLKCNADAVADKLLRAMNAGKAILADKNSVFNLVQKQAALRNHCWSQLYINLRADLMALPPTDVNDWSRIVLLFKKRQLMDEEMVMPTWRNQCPFQLNFADVFKNCSYEVAMGIYSSAF